MPAETIPALLAERVAHTPDLAAIAASHCSVSYTELDRRSAARAAGLVARGVGRTHRVGLLQQDGVDWAISTLAVMRIGAVLVPLDSALDPKALQFRLAAAAVRHVIIASASDGIADAGEGATIERAGLPTLRNILAADELDEVADNTAQAVAAALEARAARADDMVILFGSDGAAAIHGHGAAIRAIRAAVSVYGPVPGAIHLVSEPLFKIGGFGGGLLAALVVGATLLIDARADGDQSGGSAGASATLESFGPYCGHPPGHALPAGKQGSAGHVLDGIKLRVRNPGSRELVQAGETGMIEIGGHNLLRGIVGLEREQAFTADGWAGTGDMGRVDADGFVWIVAREQGTRVGRSDRG